MKVLLSAYACEPGKGSEPGVGWHWAIEVARLGHDVHVITRANNRDHIERAREQGGVPENLTFHYFDLKPWQKFWKKGNRGVHLYTILWQWGASNAALRLHAREKFDLVHHVTFASIRFPSFMWRLEIPFIFGPAGGGEAAPYALRRGYPISGKIKDWLRDLSNGLIPFDPFMRKTFATADQIWLRGSENRAFVPARFLPKVHHSVGCGVDGTSKVKIKTRADNAELRLLYVGNFLYLKGMHLGFKALAKANARVRGNGIRFTLTMVGDGPQESFWRSAALRAGAEADVVWRGRVPQSALPAIYSEHDVFLFPSLHDSAGMVVIEAALQGVPTVCLDIGGPGILVDHDRGRKVAVSRRSEDEIIDALADQLCELANQPSILEGLSESVRKWAQTMTWHRAVSEIYEQHLPQGRG